MRGLAYEIDGYAECVRNLLAGFRRHGVAVALRPDMITHSKIELSPELLAMLDEARQTPVEPRYPVIQFRLANSFQPEPGRNVYGYSMLESDRINANWVAGCNRVKEVWVPSQFNWETFTRSGAQRVQVMPLGVDPERFRPGLPPLELPFHRSFAFLASDWFFRKGPDVMVHAYYRGFGPSDDVVLLYKIKPGSTAEAQAVLAAIAGHYGGPGAVPPVVLYDTVLSWNDVPRLYSSVNCFVLPTRGEGWSLPLIEAMASGLPVICTDWSGPTQFMNAQTAFPLRITGLEHIPDFAYNEVCWQDGNWAVPDIGHLSELMRYVFTNRSEAQARGQAARSHVSGEFTWLKATERMIGRFNESGW